MELIKKIFAKKSSTKISVDYEGKLTAKERFLQKIKTSNTWIKVTVSIFKFILMLGISFVILYPFITKIAGSFMSPDDLADVTVSLIPRDFNVKQYEYIIEGNGYFTHVNDLGDAKLGAFFNTLFLSLICAGISDDGCLPCRLRYC